MIDYAQGKIEIIIIVFFQTKVYFCYIFSSKFILYILFTCLNYFLRLFTSYLLLVDVC